MTDREASLRRLGPMLDTRLTVKERQSAKAFRSLVLDGSLPKQDRHRAIVLHLPFPPSSNSLWRAVNGRNILSKKYRLWRDLAASLLMIQMREKEPIKGRYQMTVRLDRPDRRKRDLSNVGTKAIEDALVMAGIIEDDHLAQRIVVEWTDVIDKEAQAEITVVGCEA